MLRDEFNSGIGVVDGGIGAASRSRHTTLEAHDTREDTSRDCPRRGRCFQSAIISTSMSVISGMVIENSDRAH